MIWEATACASKHVITLDVKLKTRVEKLVTSEAGDMSDMRYTWRSEPYTRKNVMNMRMQLHELVEHDMFFVDCRCNIAECRIKWRLLEPQTASVSEGMQESHNTSANEKMKVTRAADRYRLHTVNAVHNVDSVNTVNAV